METTSDEVAFDGVKIHPAANIFPMMDPAAHACLLADIRQNGIKNDLQFVGDTWQDAELIDGRNRLKALQELGMSWKTYSILHTHADIPDPVKHVLSLNLHRRHLTESQRAMVAARIANLEHGTNQFKQKEDGPSGPSSPDMELSKPGVSAKQASDLLNVSRTSTKRGKTILAKGTEELITAVDAGEIKVATAERIANLPQPEQPAAIAQVIQPKAAPKPKAEPVVLPPLTDRQEKGWLSMKEEMFTRVRDYCRRTPAACTNVIADLKQLIKTIQK